MRLIPYVIILVLIAAMWHEGCQSPSVIIKTDTVITYDTIVQVLPGEPKLYKVLHIDTIPVGIDTDAILAKYYTTSEWHDTVRNDTISISITDTVGMNTILGRSVAYTLRLPIKTITNTITNTKHVSGLYIGSYATKQSIGAQATYVAPKWIGSIGYGNTGVHVGVGIKLGR